MRKELTIEEIQRASYDILVKIAGICKEQELRYCLIYGTLIGAVRHKGFIPWDDDLDIMMPRPDYERLLAYMREHRKELEPLEVFEPGEKKKYPYMIARISDSRYELETDNEEDYGIGVFIDIYPYDGLGNTPKEACSFGMKGDRLSSLCFQATRQRYAVGTTKSTLRKLLKLPVFWFARLVGKDYFQKKLSSLAGVKAYDSSEYVGCVVWLSGGKKDIFKREWFEKPVEISFCGGSFHAPKEYDKVLRHAYGDYMQLPPPEERIRQHFYRAYRKE